MIMSPLPLLHRSSKVGESGKWGEWESGNIRPPGFHVFTFKRRSGHCALRVVVRPEGDVATEEPPSAPIPGARAPCVVLVPRARPGGRRGSPGSHPAGLGSLWVGTARYRADVRVSRDLFLRTVVFENFSFYE